ncbi:hypothetical protein HPP92_027673 [Vanilla planifolia]|uniref:aminodeoxychorismate synthase n=1 Tax=Vanilla planifolia TaxID=51239 RepID=A0A835PAY2_VANPL|nr:hypothetical protein HPP92_027673 [Vanilla planifolia]
MAAIRGSCPPSSMHVRTRPLISPKHCSGSTWTVRFRSNHGSYEPSPIRRTRTFRCTLERKSNDNGEGRDHNDKYKQSVRTLLIDNYDSYTYNIYQELAVVNGVPPVVIHNDEWSWEDLHDRLYKGNEFDNIVISPGPGSPACSKDIGVCLEVLSHCGDIPIFGICLGHQALGYVYGAQVIHAPEPIHGRLSGIPSGRKSAFKVMRYHSLVIDADTLPKELIPMAWTTSSHTHFFLEPGEPEMCPASTVQANMLLQLGDLSANLGCFGLKDVTILDNADRNKILMGVMHSHKPHYGVQFHPESVATAHRRKIFENFKRITIDYGQVGGAEKIFCNIFGDKNAENTFWLDSSSIDKGRARFSFMGGKGGPLWKQITYHISEHRAGGNITIQDDDGNVKTEFLEDGFFNFLNEELNSFHYDKEDFDGLPFNFCGGFVGYIGKPRLKEVVNGESWLTQTEKKIRALKDTSRKMSDMLKSEEGFSTQSSGSFSVDKSKYQYMNDVKKCLELIRDGESYELCLTTQARKRVFNINALDFSSPERFLQLNEQGILEAKPIKGTIARGSTLEEDECLKLQLKHSEKNQAENLMIVDLLRNDLGRVCEPGSVCVPRLMEVQSYATVHTMVSTIQGKKKTNTSAIDSIKAAFPGGSMTGAPKLRSMELLDSIESSSRGIYSGSIGFISYNQTFDLNIVIRTIVIHKGEASIGAGGAIVALSDPEEEYEEMMLKARVPTKVVEECSGALDYA